MATLLEAKEQLAEVKKIVLTQNRDTIINSIKEHGQVWEGMDIVFRYKDISGKIRAKAGVFYLSCFLKVHDGDDTQDIETSELRNLRI